MHKKKHKTKIFTKSNMSKFIEDVNNRVHYNMNCLYISNIDDRVKYCINRPKLFNIFREMDSRMDLSTYDD